MNQQSLQNGQDLFIAVNCGPDSPACNFSIFAKYATELTIKDATPIKLYLNENEGRIIRFYVPESDEITHITIASRAFNSWSKFKMLT